jgi:valyl-tRNA synthetase
MKLPKVYEPQQYEKDIYALWEKSQAFVPVGDKSTTGESFSIVIPPPNANGNLHLGHALTLGLEDIAIRYHRLKGDSTLLLPGADHAGFETQVVYEKQLAKEGKSRFDFSREELYSQIWDFVALNRTNFEDQVRRIGASVDWEHYTFTLDEKVVKRAYATFKKMWDEKLIYRGERLVNYCTHHRTGFADIEVEYKEATTPLYYMKYGPFILATTRPETKFGDTAVAVHPDDERYKEWVGKTITVEGVNGSFEVRVVADEMVDPEFGTGAVKITPAHSFDDWDVAQRHDLQAIRVINHDGTMNHHAGRFEGMTILEARKAVVAALEEKGLLEKVDKKYKNRVGHCYKCGTVIEPMLMKQWFIEMESLAKPAIASLEANEIDFQPMVKRDQLVTYLKNLRDWNISRQIAWGIPIPAFQNVDDSDDWIYDERVDQETIEITTDTGDIKTYRRDPDVFDTWFSSSSWPYVTLDYPDGKDFDEFYPLSLMETGFDILYPWVSRMLMFGLYNTGKAPFKTVYLHGLVLDEHGQKMSKSKGNVINPMEIIEEFGSDALRMGIITGTSAGNNQPFGKPKIIGARNFANKLWNVARYIEDKTEGLDSLDGLKADSAADHWVLSNLQQYSQEIAKDLEDYRFAEAYDKLYHFVWDDVADWYIEASKDEPNREVLAYVLQSILQLAHPFAPFVTETIWQTLGWQQDTLLATSTWPNVADADATAVEAFEEVKSIVSEVRYLSKIFKTDKSTLYYRISDEVFAGNAELVRILSRLEAVTAAPTDVPSAVHLTQTKHVCWLDIAVEKRQHYLSELEDKQKDQEKVISQLEGRLANKAYADNAPKEVVEQTEAQLESARKILENIANERSRFAA